jgi:threonyl-tRNA synthetase
MWNDSGHIDKYHENIFITKCENKKYVIRPMNCPTCIQVYKNNSYSYKDLPIKMNEFGVVHRNETSGSLNGLFRSRSFTQDDAHIF